NLNLTMVNMNLMLGIPQNTKLSPDSSFIQQTANADNLENYEAIALKNRKDIQAIGFRKKATDVSIRSARTEGYPTIDLTAGYIAAYVPHVLSITNAANAGVGIKYNLAS